MDYWLNMSLETLENEVWKDIPGYEGLYQVSSLGRVKSLKRFYKSAIILEMPENIKTQRLNKKGYPYLHLCLNGKKWATTVHKLVILAFVGVKPDPKITINHIDGNKLNNCILNLEYCTAKENIYHFLKTVNFRQGENHCNLKLNNEKVLKIREEYALHKTKQKIIAEKYGISQVMVSRIILRKTWKHI